jgi:DNA adenine methylase
MLFPYRVGTKRQQVNALLHLLPIAFGRYIEPMCGNADLFWALRLSGVCGDALLADIDPLIVAAYIGVRDAPHDVVAALESMERTHEAFRRYQKETPEMPHGEAARAIYLGALSFNGTWRFNRRGHFSSSYNHRPERVPKAETILRASSFLQGIDVRCCDYEEATSHAQKNDLVYFDPPYYGGSRMYRDRFDHERLRRVADDLHRRGVYVMVSYRAHPHIDALYEGWNRIVVPVRQNVPVDSRLRGYVQDVAYLSYDTVAHSLLDIVSLSRETGVS